MHHAVSLYLEILGAVAFVAIAIILRSTLRRGAR